jgi:hypothetical protein
LTNKLLAPEASPICKQALSDLSVVKLRYWGFDDKAHIGALIVHQSLAKEVIEIFQALFAQRFPIQSIAPQYSTNQTAAFNCREVTDQRGIISQHTFGRAIDINPMINPYVKGSLIIPEGAKSHIDRKQLEKGKISPNSFVTLLFAKYGWDWGGNWYDLQDYQHFEKRANGEKRNPYGYAPTRTNR